MHLTNDLHENLQALEERLGMQESFDVLTREIRIGGRDAVLLFLDGFTKDEVTTKIMIRLQEAKREETVPQVVKKLLARIIPFAEIETADTVDDVIKKVLSGPMAILIDGVDQAIIVDVREYQVRSIEEPDTERVTRGARDGFTETLVFNTSLIRRRLRDPGLRMEMIEIGERSKSDVALVYVKDVAHPKYVEEMRRRLNNIQAEALPMAGKSIEEFIFGTSLNPFPVVRYTERPDVVTTHLLEGHVAVVADTSPTVMIAPANVWHFVQHSEEFLQNPLVGTYMRWVRMMGIFLAVFLTPVWLMLVMEKQHLPEFLQFLGPREEVTIPLGLQLLILTIGVDLIRLALVHTPNALATSLGIVGAVLLGEVAAEVGLISPEIILYVAISALGFFATPNLEFGLAIRIFHILIVVLTILFSWVGLLIGTVFMVVVAGMTKGLGLPYLWPLIPFNGQGMARILWRHPVPAVRDRPQFTEPQSQNVPNRPERPAAQKDTTTRSRRERRGRGGQEPVGAPGGVAGRDVRRRHRSR